MRFLPLLVLAFCSCFDSGIAPLICSSERPGCPEGYTCRGGICENEAVDMSVVTDLINADIAGYDLMPIAGCADKKGAQIGTKGCWGCPGIFNGLSVKASSLCSITHKPALNSALISDSECLSVSSGFFLSAQYGATSKNYADPNMIECGSFTMSGNRPTYFGCGVGGGVVAMNLNCNGFRPNIQCLVSNGINCTNANLDDSQNTSASNGVICCPK